MTVMNMDKKEPGKLLSHLRRKIRASRTYEEIIKRKHLDTEFSLKKKKIDDNKQIVFNKHKQTCAILKDHVNKLKDDPERLSTDFIKELIGNEKCEGVE